MAKASAQHEITAKHTPFIVDIVTVAKRAVRSVLREPEFIIPALIIPLFFFVVNTGSLSEISNFAGIENYNAFQLPVAIIFAVTGVSRAAALVADISSGYFDRLLMTPISRPALLLGLMVADFLTVVALSIPVVILGFVTGVDYQSGILGVLLFIGIAASWGMAFTGFPYAIALKTGNAAAVNSSFLLFFPFAFLTTTFLPQDALSGWLATAATYNPVTYILAGSRSLITEGWVISDLAKTALAIGCVAIISQLLAYFALRSRLRID